MECLELKELYNDNFTLSYLGEDINTKFALISLISYLQYKLKNKNPNITHYQIIKQIIKDQVPEKFIIGLSIMCEDLSYGCSEFPTFGLSDKEIPNKIKEILQKYLPF